MTSFDSLIFDLDGTLWDATATTARGWNQALRKLGISDRELRAEDIARVAGMPFIGCVSTLFPELAGGSLEELARSLDEHEEAAIKLLGGTLYDGVAAGLARLKARVPLFVVSNCQDWYLDAFLSIHKLRSTFTDCECHGRTQRPKAENIRDVVRRNGLKAPIYIGDTRSDEEAAALAEIPFIHVSYGFGRVSPACTSFPSFDSLVGALLNLPL